MSEDKPAALTGWDKAGKLAQMFALIGMPVVVAIVGYWTQKSLAESGARKDYVQMALQVLREPRRTEDESIRKWAGEIIAVNSPVPFTAKAADQLAAALDMVKTNPFLAPAMEERPSCPAALVPGLNDAQTQAMKTLLELCERNYSDLFWMRNYIRLLRGEYGPYDPVVRLKAPPGRPASPNPQSPR